MQFSKVRPALFPVCAIALLLGSARFAVSAFAAELPTGSWLEAACNEGDSGPDLPPPPYIRGVIRFAEHKMSWSSRIYDDKDCSVLRPGTITETQVPYSVAAGAGTTDGSLAIDAVVPNPEDGSSVTMFGLLKVQDGMMYLAFYPTAEGRPKALDRSQAQVFSRL